MNYQEVSSASKILLETIFNPFNKKGTPLKILKEVSDEENGLFQGTLKLICDSKEIVAIGFVVSKEMGYTKQDLEKIDDYDYTSIINWSMKEFITRQMVSN